MAEVSKESINEDLSTENTDSNADIVVNDSVVETKMGSTEVIINESSDEINSDDVRTTSNTSVENIVVEDNLDCCNGETEVTQIQIDELTNDDSVTIISENEQVLISVDVEKLMDGATEEEVASANNIDDDNEVVEVVTPPPSERNVEEGGEWSAKSRLQSFVRWSRSKGFTLSPKVEVMREGTCHRYGMVATADIKRGETICSTPRSFIFNPDNSRIVAEIVNYEDWLDTIGQSLDDSSGWATLLIALMVEYNDVDSYWAPYLRLVPKPEECGHPLFWSIEEHKDELRGTTLLYDIQRDIYNIESEYKQFVLPFIYRYKDICGNVERYSLGLYKRLVAFVMSYSFTEDFGSEPNMIPLADLMNHHSTNNNAKLIFGEENVEVIAIKNINKGEEILNTFGKLGNAELLQTYGYTDKEPNVYDTFPVLVNTFLDVMEKEEKVSESYFQAKISLLNKTEIAHSDDFFLFDRNGMRRGPDLVQMLKILFMPENEFDDLLKSRAGNRPDSFYQKLLRKLKLSKRTDTSSGIAIIDITDEEPEQESAPKRKLDVELHEIEDSEPPIKQTCDSMPLRHISVVTLSCRDPELSPVNNLQADNGDSICNAILIDDDDDEDSDDDSKNTEEKSDANEGKLPDNENDENGDNTIEAAESTNMNDKGATDLLAEECLINEDKPQEPEKMEVEAAIDNNSTDGDNLAEEKVDEKPEDVKCNEEKENTKEDDADKTKEISEDHTEEDLKEECEKKNENEDEILECKINEKEKDSTINCEVEESKDTSIISESVDTLSDDNVRATGDGIDGDIGEQESDVDDIKIVCEDIRCKMTYEFLNEDLKPEWKEFMRSVVNFQINSLKADDILTVDEARNKMSDRQFFSYQIRNGHRHIAEIFLSSVNTNKLEK